MEKKSVFGLVIVIILLSSLVALGCAAPAPAPAPSPAPSPAPADSVEVYKWTVQSQWPATHLHHLEFAKAFEQIKIASNGRLVPTVHSTNEVVPFYEEYKAVKEGTIDAAFCGGDEWRAVLGQKANLIGGTGVPGGPSVEEYMAHFYQGNGMKLSNDLYGDWGEVVGAMGICTEIFCHSNKILATAEDFKGVKFRSAGTWGDILSEYYGASVVHISGGEVYQSAEKGVIDAFEYGTPCVNWPMGFHQIMSYLGLPGIHSPAGLALCVVNNQSWAELPDDLQKIIFEVFMARGYDGLMYQHHQDGQALQNFKDYGTEIFRVDEGFQRDIIEKSKEFHMGFYDEDPKFKLIWDDMEAFSKAYKQHAEVSTSINMFDID